MLIEKLPNARCAAKLIREISMREPRKAARRVLKPLVLYGAGKFGKMAIELLEKVGITDYVVADINAESILSAPFWHGRHLVHPDKLDASIKHDSLLAVSIATEPFEELAKKLAAQGWKDIVPFYDIAQAYSDCYPLGNGWELDIFEEDEVVATSEVLARWDDDISRAHHLQFIAWHRLREDWVFRGAQVHQGNKYFIPQIVKGIDKNSSLLDVGAHHGEVCQRFIKQTSGRFRSAWMLEPDPANARAIRQWLDSLEDNERSNISLFEFAASEKCGKENFFGNIGYASQISPHGSMSVSVSTIDELSLSPTFVKLHIEGNELKALKGAQETLRRNRPFIAMTIYHNRLGVWEAPLWVMQTLKELDTGYRFYLRLHSWCGTGAVLYAIPSKPNLTN